MRPTPASGTTNDQGYVFADFDPNDSSGKYIPDNDADTYQTPFVQQLSKGQTRGPVPTPRVYPRLDLATVVGANPPGYAASSAGKSIAFDIVGDSGAPTQQKLDEYEVKVTELMSSYAAQSPPTSSSRAKSLPAETPRFLARVSLGSPSSSSPPNTATQTRCADQNPSYRYNASSAATQPVSP